jgi:signal peptidase I
MADRKTKKSRPDKSTTEKKDRAAEIANIFEWLITAFILAFVFRAFVMEAFRIPTGSMADTLKGAHFRLRCPQCGYKYEHGFSPSSYFDRNGRRLAEDTVPAGTVALPRTRCPSCGYYPMANTPAFVANGDRILVLKCIYEFFEPKRWDVIVFKNPQDPDINYIKRLVALPGESVQIIDGDIYINGQIARKCPKVQDEQWMPVYDNDYQPVNPYIQSFNGHSWDQPFQQSDFSFWKIDPSHPTEFDLDSSPDKTSFLEYSTKIGNDFRVIYAYNSVDLSNRAPYCSDLMVRFYCKPGSNRGSIGISLSKYETIYRAWIDFTGQMIITKNENGREPIELARKGVEPVDIHSSKLMLVKFANVDHQLILEYGQTMLIYDLGRGPEDAGQIKASIEPNVKIFGSGKQILSHIAIFRDIHYTEEGAGYRGRAIEEPFLLGGDEFFVLGDNSPNSEDCRWWRNKGTANIGIEPYRAGIVPRDYLVGKALFVYWPSGFRPFRQFPFGIIPNVGELRFIYGGSNKKILEE